MATTNPIKLTKTDFILFLNCGKSLWLKTHKPNVYPEGEFSAYAQKLAKEGYEVEAQVRALVATWADADRYSFQRVFEPGEGLFAKADMVRDNEDGTIDLFEIKSSTSVKDRNPHNQLKDAAFQTIAAKRCGEKVRNITIVHLNKDYVREGDIDPEELLTFADETVRVKALLAETESEITEAMALLSLDAVDETSCTCLHLSRNNQCDSFTYFNRNIPTPSIYSLPRLSQAKRDLFVAEDRISLDKISVEELTRLQQPVLKAHQSNAPYINLPDIENFLGVLKYPLHFLDYETYASAIPITNGVKSQSPLPFQFSLHVQSENGELEHHEFLADQAERPLALIEHLERTINPTGSIIVWNKTFENTQNKTMAADYPDKAEFLLGLVSRTADLMDVFLTGYVDIRFDGSVSIKKVLPVVVPELSYDGMDVGDGTAAMETWARMLSETDLAKRAEQRQALLDYCELDSLAMVKILKFVGALTSNNGTA
ncbi:MAG: DUF2779 domain-containing protein [Armatimonadetes bacterium]|nr:DUF2779 domain-containing protein [Armatimonadota bacterium]